LTIQEGKVKKRYRRIDRGMGGQMGSDRSDNHLLKKKEGEEGSSAGSYTLRRRTRNYWN